MDINEIEVGRIYKSGLGIVMAVNGLSKEEGKFKAVGISGYYDRGFLIDACAEAFSLEEDQDLGR